MNPPSDPRDDFAAGTITAIVFEKTPVMKRAAVFVDDRPAVYALRRDVAQSSAGDAVSGATLIDWQQRYQKRGAYLQAILFLGPRDRSAREVRQHLVRKGWSGAACDQALQKLKEEGYVDDRKFAERWVAYRCRTAPRSRMALLQELNRKGIARETILAALEPIREDALALECARRKMRQWRRYEDAERRLRIMVFLQRRGFSYEACRKAAAALDTPGHDD